MHAFWQTDRQTDEQTDTYQQQQLARNVVRCSLKTYFVLLICLLQFNHN